MYEYTDWGLWVQDVHNNELVRIRLGLSAEPFRVGTDPDEEGAGYLPPPFIVGGTPTGTSPVSGSAVWTGSAKGIYSNTDVVQPVTGQAELTVDFADNTLDAVFNGWSDALVPEISFAAVPLADDGSFYQGTKTLHRDQGGGSSNCYNCRSIYRGINGDFYGPNHEAAAGSFGAFGIDNSNGDRAYADKLDIEGIFAADRDAE